jgi:hypothetical protein
VGTTVSVTREPAIDPEKCAGGAGSMEIGPTSIRYVPSASNVPSARMIGRGNWPCPHPTARVQLVSVTERQAPSPVHRPVARGASPGPVGTRLQASRPQHATIAVTSTRRVGGRVMPRYNAWRHADQNVTGLSFAATGWVARISLDFKPRWQTSRPVGIVAVRIGFTT